jgi:crotonobetainyl-CoA:carnitine CoA-transferase CaiB-like acyl-CoA transferase
MNTSPNGLPLEGVRVVEFTHMVMGPTCGMILADLGAEVIKIEPPCQGWVSVFSGRSIATKKA